MTDSNDNETTGASGVASSAMLDEGAPSGDKSVCLIHITREDHQRLMRADLPGIGSAEDRKFKRDVYDRIEAMKADDPTIEVRVQVFHSSNTES
jgi:hypothetical protein